MYKAGAKASPIWRHESFSPQSLLPPTIMPIKPVENTFTGSAPSRFINSLTRRLSDLFFGIFKGVKAPPVLQMFEYNVLMIKRTGAVDQKNLIPRMPKKDCFNQFQIFHVRYLLGNCQWIETEHKILYKSTKVNKKSISEFSYNIYFIQQCDDGEGMYYPGLPT